MPQRLPLRLLQLLATFQLIIGVLLLLVSEVPTLAERLDTHTFMPPFEEVDTTGSRIVNKLWRPSGTTEVNKYFIRLTPDRQSKKGALWSRKALNTNSISAILQFRISGQGKNFFGDGIALWISHSSYHMEGIIHGSVEKFTGIGIIFDTFRNTENLKAHRDVTVLVNDGQQTYEMMTEKVQGCNTNLRYHAERADFDVSASSRAKIVIDDNKALEIMIDSDNAGEFIDCARVDLSALLPPNWLAAAYVGITATTGALADNHDILSLKTFSGTRDADGNLLPLPEEHESDSSSSVKFDLNLNAPIDTNLAIIASMINKMVKQQEHLEHTMEHSNVATIDHIKNLINKLVQREDKAEDRLEKLEDMAKMIVEHHMEERLTELENDLNQDVHKRMTNIEKALDRKMIRIEDKASELTKKYTIDAGGWKLPFFFLVLLFVGAAVLLYLFYEKMRKIHLL